MREHGLAVDDIEAIDGSYRHVNNKLADIFPGARTAAKGEELRDTYDETDKPVRKPPENAQIGMQTVFSLVSGMFKTVTFTAGSADERAFVPVDKNIPYLKSRTRAMSAMLYLNLFIMPALILCCATSAI